MDALYAVYEASTLELWSFMMTSAINGRDLITVSIFYAMLLLFIVILLQVYFNFYSQILLFVFSKVYS